MRVDQVHVVHLRRFTVPALALASIVACAAPAPQPQQQSFAEQNPWPTIRQERIRTLLPRAMAAAGVDAWVIMLRENANDPLALHVGGENAGAPAAVLFLRSGDSARSVIISGFGEAIALRELGLHDSVVVYEREPGALEAAVAERLRAANASRIAINSSASGVTDGLSWTQRTSLERALGPAFVARLVSSHDIVQEWL